MATRKAPLNIVKGMEYAKVAAKFPWNCKHGHPLHLTEWGKRCNICPSIAQGHRQLTLAFCPGGHLYVVGSKGGCAVCKRHRQVPWQKVLDTTGKAVCPRGHEITHDDLSYGVDGRRYCLPCLPARIGAANTGRLAREDQSRNSRTGLCGNGLHPWVDSNIRRSPDGKARSCRACDLRRRSAEKFAAKIEEEENSELPVDWVDWVMVYRLMRFGASAVYYYRRGLTNGATPGEQWVAYCTWKTIHGGREPNRFAQFGSERVFAWYGEVGRYYGFTELDMYQLIGGLDSKQNYERTLLNGGKKRKAPWPDSAGAPRLTIPRDGTE